MTAQPPPDAAAPVDCYSLYGLRVALQGTAARLPAVSVPGRPGIRLDVSGFPASIPLTPRELIYGSPGDESGHRNGLRVYRLAGSPFLHFTFPEEIEFLIHPESFDAYGKWPAHYRLDYVAPTILGPLMGMLLRLHAVTTLHASVIAINGRAIALTGPGGAGKSTTAAAFAKAGFPVLSDDLAPLRPAGRQLLVAPGYPRVCLWPESVRLLFGDEQALPLITEGWEKRFLDLSAPPARFASQPLPLGAVYWISERSLSPQPARIEPLDPQHALDVLIGNTYAARLGGLQASARDLKTFAALISQLPVRRVSPGSGLQTLQSLCESIAQDASHV